MNIEVSDYEGKDDPSNALWEAWFTLRVIHEHQ
jgi:hypothetical protein